MQALGGPDLVRIVHRVGGWRRLNGWLVGFLTQGVQSWHAVGQYQTIRPAYLSARLTSSGGSPARGLMLSVSSEPAPPSAARLAALRRFLPPAATPPSSSESPSSSSRPVWGRGLGSGGCDGWLTMIALLAAFWSRDTCQMQGHTHHKPHTRGTQRAHPPPTPDLPLEVAPQQLHAARAVARARQLRVDGDAHHPRAGEAREVGVLSEKSWLPCERASLGGHTKQDTLVVLVRSLQQTPVANQLVSPLPPL